MKIKASFFDDSNQKITLDDFDHYFRTLLLDAYKKRFNSAADAKFYLALQGMDLDIMISIFIPAEKTGLLNTSIANALFYPVGCGDITNSFCTMMVEDSLFTPRTGNPPPLSKLLFELEKNLPKLIRIDIPGHAYVMLASEKTNQGVLGYIYQSNIAEGMEDNSFSLATWLMDPKSHKTNLTQHLQQVNRLLEVETSCEEKCSIYRELFFAQPTVAIKVPANLNEIIKNLNDQTNISRYKVKEIDPQTMIATLQLFEKEFKNLFAELKQSLDDYIQQIKEKIAKEEAEMEQENLNNKFST